MTLYRRVLPPGIVNLPVGISRERGLSLADDTLPALKCIPSVAEVILTVLPPPRPTDMLHDKMLAGFPTVPSTKGAGSLTAPRTISAARPLLSNMLAAPVASSRKPAAGIRACPATCTPGRYDLCYTGLLSPLQIDARLQAFAMLRLGLAVQLN